MPALSSASSFPAIIYSLGTSTRCEDDFITILKSFAIKALVDVRRFPQSRRYPHFSRQRLATRTPKEGVEYFYLGDELGGFRRPDYIAYMNSESFCSGIEQLEGIAARCSTVFCCAEALPWRCHRRFIARELTSRGWRVLHILDEKITWEMRAEKENRKNNLTSP